MSVLGQEIWDKIAALVRAEGFELFDLDLPSDRHRSLRVFVAGAGTGLNGVTHDDCARISRKLDSITDLEAELPDNCIVEVSSPGVNRRLRLPHHFEQALGERVKLTLFSRRVFKDTVMRGTLESFERDAVGVREEGSGEKIEVPLAEIKRAQIDFKFD